MRNAPKETVDAWLRTPTLDPVRLVPALLVAPARKDPLAPNQAVRFLTAAVSRGNASATVHNLLLTLFARMDDEGPLLRYLAEGEPRCDLDYALRTCATHGRSAACVHLYAAMGRWEDAVDLALARGDVERARAHADRPADDTHLRRRLWLKIAKYVVGDKGDIRTAMQFLESTDLLKIEDILPFFPDFVVIDDFKEEICGALEGYAAHIEQLRREMDDATANAAAIKRDIAQLKNRCVGTSLC